MSTICKVALTAEAVRVVPALEQFLRERALPFEVTETEWPAASIHENFQNGEDFPSIFSARQVTPEVTEIHFNSFSKVEDLASHLSAVTGAKGVVNIYQSVSTASYWAFHDDGRLVRAIEADDAIVSSQSGERLVFEHEEPGRPYDDEGYMVFDCDEQDWYNREVGVPVEVYQEYESSWKNFVLAGRRSDSRSQSQQHQKQQKPWWRFW